jgi:hypothetical protein
LDSSTNTTKKQNKTENQKAKPNMPATKRAPETKLVVVSQKPGRKASIS